MSTGVGIANYDKTEKWNGDPYFSAHAGAGIPGRPSVDTHERWVNMFTPAQYPGPYNAVGVTLGGWTFNQAARTLQNALSATDAVCTLYSPGTAQFAGAATFLGVAGEKVRVRVCGSCTAGTVAVLLGATVIATLTVAQFAAAAADGYIDLPFTVVGAPTTLTLRGVGTTTAVINSVSVSRYSDRYVDYFTANTGQCT